MPSERSSSENTAHCTTPLLWHSYKARLQGQQTHPWLPTTWVREEIHNAGTKDNAWRCSGLTVVMVIWMCVLVKAHPPGTEKNIDFKWGGGGTVFQSYSFLPCDLCPWCDLQWNILSPELCRLLPGLHSPLCSETTPERSGSDHPTQCYALCSPMPTYWPCSIHCLFTRF
jgi:hypothetical protein